MFVCTSQLAAYRSIQGFGRSKLKNICEITNQGSLCCVYEGRDELLALSDE